MSGVHNGVKALVKTQEVYTSYNIMHIHVCALYEFQNVMDLIYNLVQLINFFT